MSRGTEYPEFAGQILQMAQGPAKSDRLPSEFIAAIPTAAEVLVRKLARTLSSGAFSCSAKISSRFAPVVMASGFRKGSQRTLGSIQIIRGKRFMRSTMTRPTRATMDCTMEIVFVASPIVIPKDSFTIQNPAWLA